MTGLGLWAGVQVHISAAGPIAGTFRTRWQVASPCQPTSRSGPSDPLDPLPQWEAFLREGGGEGGKGWLLEDFWVPDTFSCHLGFPRVVYLPQRCFRAT